MLWEPFLMKVLLKKKVCDSQEQCMGLTRKHRNMLLNEEKKTLKHKRTAFQLYPN